MIFKSPRIEAEFQKIDKGLRYILLYLDSIARAMGFEDGLIITCLIRKPDENRSVGGDDDSKHLTGEAADIRWWVFAPYPEKLEFLLNSLKWLPELACYDTYIAVHKKEIKIDGEKRIVRHIHLQVNFPTKKLIKHKIGGNNGMA